MTGDRDLSGCHRRFDIDSVGLINFISMNPASTSESRSAARQRSWVPAATPARWTCITRRALCRKVEAGAEYFFSQPVFDLDMLERFRDLTKAWSDVPFTGHHAARERSKRRLLHNEARHGLTSSDGRSRRADQAAQRERPTGRPETLSALRDHPRIRGAYIYPPFEATRRSSASSMDWSTPTTRKPINIADRLQF